jgi:Mannosyl-glycoprotein endo-beta-N-acetylglucosaminidase
LAGENSGARSFATSAPNRNLGRILASTRFYRGVGALVVGILSAALPVHAAPPSTPEIRTNAANRVPACVTPDRMMRHLTTMNEKLDPKFSTITTFYKQHGDALGVRWDYAIYQMILETNYLKFKRGDGSFGDVKIRQNNFAGVGATGGGVPGDSFPDVSTGVLAQMQHLVAYSGEKVEKPVAPRTREQQDGIIAQTLRMKRPMRFGDLTNRWAADRNYARSIEAVADRYRALHCTGREEPVVALSAPVSAPTSAPVPAVRPQKPTAAAFVVTPTAAAVAPNGTAKSLPPAQCSVMTASYGGSSALLIRSEKAAAITYTALRIDPNQEQVMGASYIASHATGGTIVGRFATQDAAVKEAMTLCSKAKN